MCRRARSTLWRARTWRHSCTTSLPRPPCSAITRHQHSIHDTKCTQENITPCHYHDKARGPCQQDVWGCLEKISSLAIKCPKPLLFCFVMKFEEQLDVHAVPEWRSQYVNYTVRGLHVELCRFHDMCENVTGAFPNARGGGGGFFVLRFS